MINEKLTHWILLLGSFVYVGIGLVFVLWPKFMGAQVAISLNSPTALADFRAVYGGLQLGVGAFLGYCACKKEMHHAGLLLACCCFGGLFGVRVLSHLLQPSWDGLHFALGGAELVGVLVALWGLSKLRAA
ncbi:MAG: DUF4345 family protein [Myxococcales bacterium]|nr:DUF4345 family protein [Myxococcales bacterium]